jgi:translation initiation factor 5A
MSDNYEIDTTDAGSSQTVSVEAGQIRKGGYIMIKGKPCKVKDVSVSKTGKHGHAKCKFSASDIFTGASCEELCPSTHSIDVPVVNKTDWMIQGLQDDTYVLLMNDDGEMREDLQLPSVMYKTEDDMKTTDMIKEYCEMVNNGSNIDIYCSILSAVGQEKIIDVRKKNA